VLVLKVFLKRTLQREMLIVCVCVCVCVCVRARPQTFSLPHPYFLLPINLSKNLRERILKVRYSAVIVLAIEVCEGTVVSVHVWMLLF